MAQAHLSEDLKRELREEKKEARKYFLVWPVGGFLAIGLIAVFWKMYYKPLNQVKVEPTQQVSYPPTASGENKAATPTATPAATPTPKTTPKPTPTATPAASNKVHSVAEGDTLWTIAEQYSKSVADILTANNLSEDSILQIGQKITIPN